MTITGLYSVNDQWQSISGAKLIMKNWSTWIKTYPITVMPTTNNTSTDLGANADLHMTDQQITTRAMPVPSRTDNMKDRQSFNMKILAVSMKHSATFIQFSINTEIHKFSITLGARKIRWKKVDGPQTLNTTTQNLVVQANCHLGFMYPSINVLHCAFQSYCQERDT